MQNGTTYLFNNFSLKTGKEQQLIVDHFSARQCLQRVQSLLPCAVDNTAVAKVGQKATE